MAQFLGDIAFRLDPGPVASGLALLRAGHERSASLVRDAGWVPVVGATAKALCTTCFWLRYPRAGDFDRAARPPVVEEMAASPDSLDIARLS